MAGKDLSDRPGPEGTSRRPGSGPNPGSGVNAGAGARIEGTGENAGSGTKVDGYGPKSCPRSSRCDVEKDLTWLLHRAAQVVGAAVQRAMVVHGLEGMRDYIVLVVLCDGVTRTQLVLGQEVGLDKTTLTTVLDRLERAGLVVRRIDPNNRRARFPEITDAGRALEATLQEERQRVEAELLAGLPADARERLPALLTHLIAAGEGTGVSVTGSCV